MARERRTGLGLLVRPHWGGWGALGRDRVRSRRIRPRATIRKTLRAALVYVLSLAVAPAAVQGAVPIVQSPAQLPFLVTPVEVFAQQAAPAAPAAIGAFAMSVRFAGSSDTPSLPVLLAAAVEFNRTPVAAQPEPEARFDHEATAFSLTGAHRIVQCEECHLNGVFDGTPTQCGACHNGSRTVGTPPDHLPTTQQCADCHETSNFSVVRLFDHTQTFGTCATCHNGARVPGKPPNHPLSSNICEDCHISLDWSLINFDHSSVTGTCASCHNGTAATGKPANHIPTSNVCEDCHITADWSIVRFDHTGVTGTCASCHNGTTATGKPTNHIPTSNVCEDCHVSTDWSIINFDHAGVTGTCASCHNGTTATGKPANHIPTSNVCEDCHDSTDWSIINFDHAGVTGTCASCHNGTTATGKPTNHIADQQCLRGLPRHHQLDDGQVRSRGRDRHLRQLPQRHDGDRQADESHPDEQCLRGLPRHARSGRSSHFDHAGVTGTCASCHNGTTATGKPTNHIPTSNVCEDCHVTHGLDDRTVRPRARHRHLRELPQRHDGDRQADQPHPDQQCLRGLPHHHDLDDGHASTTPASPGPAQAATTARRRPASRRTTSPTSNVCEDCHVTTNWTTVTVRPRARHRHLRQLPQRHDGDRQAVEPHLRRPAMSARTATSRRNWTTVQFDHSAVTGTCASCHNGTTATGKPSNHIPTTQCLRGLPRRRRTGRRCGSTTAPSPAPAPAATMARRRPASRPTTSRRAMSARTATSRRPGRRSFRPRAASPAPAPAATMARRRRASRPTTSRPLPVRHVPFHARLDRRPLSIMRGQRVRAPPATMEPQPPASRLATLLRRTIATTAI